MKVLVATYPYAGHINPTQPVVCELVRRGHEVVWMTGPAYEARVVQTGARFAAMSEAALIDDANIHRIEGTVTLAKVADYLRRLFLDRIPAQIADYDRVILGTTQEGQESQEDQEETGQPGRIDQTVQTDPTSPTDHPDPTDAFDADILVVEFCTYAARCYSDRAGLPYATLGINPLVTLDPEIPPWGSGEQPPTTCLARLRNRVRHQLGILFFISRLSAALNRQRRRLGLPPRSRWRSYADDVRSPDLHIMATTPAFEFPRRNLLPSVRFVGPLLPSWLDGPTGQAPGDAHDDDADNAADDDADDDSDDDADASKHSDDKPMAEHNSLSDESDKDERDDGHKDQKDQEHQNSSDASTSGKPDAEAPAASPDNLPPWWAEMLAHPRERVVHLTQGTIATNTDLLVRPTVEALADRDDLLVVITGRNVDALFEEEVHDADNDGSESDDGAEASDIEDSEDDVQKAKAAAAAAKDAEDAEDAEEAAEAAEAAEADDAAATAASATGAATAKQESASAATTTTAGQGIEPETTGATEASEAPEAPEIPEAADVTEATETAEVTEIRPTPDPAAAAAAAASASAIPVTRMRRPANVRTAAFVPHGRLLPHVGVMVTNAGYNGVLAALSCGVPLVCAGRSEDKADVSSRVAWAGAGIDLATGAPSAAAVRAAVLRIVDEPAWRAAAARIGDDFAQHNGPAEAVDELEALVRRKQADKADKAAKAKRDAAATTATMTAPTVATMPTRRCRWTWCKRVWQRLS